MGLAVVAMLVGIIQPTFVGARGHAEERHVKANLSLLGRALLAESGSMADRVQALRPETIHWLHGTVQLHSGVSGGPTEISVAVSDNGHDAVLSTRASTGVCFALQVLGAAPGLAYVSWRDFPCDAAQIPAVVDADDKATRLEWSSARW